MGNQRTLLIAVVVVVFVAVGGFLIFKGVGGGGSNLTLTLAVTGSTMTPDNPTARQNDNLTVTVTADRAEEIHLHGYDIVFHPAPGKPDTKTFKADKSGDFEIEIETTGTPLGKLTVNP